MDFFKHVYDGESYSQDVAVVLLLMLISQG